MAMEIGIDLGTSSIKVYVRGKGITIDEPAVVAYDKDTDKIKAFGDEAMQMIGQTPGNIIAIHPLRQGTITDYVITEQMLQYFIQKAMGYMTFFKPRIVICVPSAVTELERRAVEEAAYQAGARDVALIKVPLAAALGAELDIMRPCGNMVVDIGGGVTEIGVLSLGGIVLSQSIPVAGDNFDEAIVQYIRKNHDMFIGLATAEEIKRQIGTAMKRPQTRKLQVRGRSIAAGIPKTISMTSDEVRAAVSRPIRRIVSAVHNVLERTPPDLAVDISQRGIVLTGGGSLLGGIEEAVSYDTGIVTTVAEEPAFCVANGTGRYFEKMAELEKRRGK